MNQNEAFCENRNTDCFNFIGKNSITGADLGVVKFIEFEKSGMEKYIKSYKLNKI